MDRIAQHPAIIERSCRCRGFTLVEVMVTVAVLAILASAGMPSFTRMIASQRTGSAAADLYVALTRARSEAVKRDTDVVLAPTVAGQWQQGWFIANPGLAGANLDVHRAMGNVTITGPAKVTYHANGRLGGGAIVSFDISASGVADHRCVSVDLSGRPYQKASGC